MDLGNIDLDIDLYNEDQKERVEIIKGDQIMISQEQLKKYLYLLYSSVYQFHMNIVSEVKTMNFKKNSKV